MTEPATANLPEYSVSEIAGALKRTVEDAFPFVRVRGEISGLKAAASGHIYFDLKDDKAVLNAIIWKQTARLIRLTPESGLEVVCTGRITTYPGSSRYQIIVEQIELAGAGAIMAMLEARKQKLAAEGLFDAARKKTLPFLPNVIGVISSPTGAVIRDIMHRLDDRFPRRVLLWAVAVQGERAAAEVSAAIRGFNALAPGGRVPKPDLLIVARGGGSVEDLLAFSEESVVRAAAESAIPLISAVGHETDTTLIDFASDRRAPTPTAAAEMAVPVRNELIAQTLDFERRVLQCFTRGITQRRTHLGALVRILPRADALFAPPRQRLDIATDKLRSSLRASLQAHRAHYLEAASLLRPQPIRRHVTVCLERSETLGHRLTALHRGHLAAAARRLAALSRVLDSVSYKGVLDRGFALVRGADGTLRRRADAIAAGERLELTFTDGRAHAVAASGAPAPASRKPGKTVGKQGDLF